MPKSNSNNICTNNIMGQHILNKYFDKIYVLYINEYELDRIIYKTSLINLNVEFFMGVDGRKRLLNDYYQYRKERDSLPIKTGVTHVGAYGHIHSMINIMKDAISKKYNKILILEPDVYFSTNMNPLTNLLKKIDNKFKLLYLGASQHDWVNIDKQLALHQDFYYASETYGTFAIGINKEIFVEYLNLLNTKDRASDATLKHFHKKYPKDCYVLYPNLISCDVTKSSTVERWRSQKALNDKFRWNNNYSIVDRFKYDIPTNCIYKIVIKTNHCLKNGYIKIGDIYDDITPLFSVPNDCITGPIDNTYIIYFYNRFRNIYVYTNQCYLDTIEIIEVFNNVDRQIAVIYPQIFEILKTYLNSKNKSIVNYYKKMLDDLKIFFKVII